VLTDTDLAVAGQDKSLRHRDLVSPSLAEACIALDVPLGLAVLVVALA
jgi:hypothetical protein